MFLRQTLFVLIFPSFALCSSLNSGGHYRGTVTRHMGGRTESGSISLQVEQVDKWQWSISFEEAQTQILPPEISVSGSFWFWNGLTVSGLPQQNEGITLESKSENNCWTSEDNHVVLCQDDHRFELDVRDGKSEIKLTADLDSSLNPLPLRAEKSVFTIEELQSRSASRSFENRKAYQGVVQAQRTSRASYLALVPRLTVSSVINTLGGGLAGALSVVGELVPFLFPSNWYRASENDLRSELMLRTHQILKADTIVQVEVLADLILRDIAISSAYEVLKKELESLRDQIQAHEQAGRYPVGSTDHVAALINSLEQDLVILEDNVEDQEQDLSLMVGFPDPKTISEISWQKEPYPISSPFVLTDKDAVQKAVERSLELKQVGKLIELAKVSEEKTHWNWIDPGGDYAMGGGLATGELVEVSRAHVRSMEIEMARINGKTVQAGHEAVHFLGRSQEIYKLSSENLNIQRRRTQVLKNQITAGEPVDFYGLLQVFQDYLAAQVKQASSLADYRVARARALRLILEGGYQPTAIEKP